MQWAINRPFAKLPWQTPTSPLTSQIIGPKHANTPIKERVVSIGHFVQNQAKF